MRNEHGSTVYRKYIVPCNERRESIKPRLALVWPTHVVTRTRFAEVPTSKENPNPIRGTLTRTYIHVSSSTPRKQGHALHRSLRDGSIRSLQKHVSILISDGNKRGGLYLLSSLSYGVYKPRTRPNVPKGTGRDLPAISMLSPRRDPPVDESPCGGIESPRDLQGTSAENSRPTERSPGSRVHLVGDRVRDGV